MVSSELISNDYLYRSSIGLCIRAKYMKVPFSASCCEVSMSPHSWHGNAMGILIDLHH